MWLLKYQCAILGGLTLIHVLSSQDHHHMNYSVSSDELYSCGWCHRAFPIANTICVRFNRLLLHTHNSGRIYDLLIDCLVFQMWLLKYQCAILGGLTLIHVLSSQDHHHMNYSVSSDELYSCGWCHRTFPNTICVRFNRLLSITYRRISTRWFAVVFLIGPFPPNTHVQLRLNT